jgi:hypothetical protein
MIFSDFAKQFAGRKYLRRKTVLRVQTWAHTKREHLYVEDPVILARFISEIKQLAAKRMGAEIYLRGQAEDFLRMVPSLFRPMAADAESDRLLRAYDDLCSRLPKVYGLGRFRRPKIGALLQHYGLRTPWLDLVDNLFVAAWFGLHKPDEVSLGWRRSTMEYGWIHAVASASLDGSKLDVCDLRREHHPLSVRLHTQHGMSVCRPNRGRDFSNYLAASVRFPVNDCWISSVGCLSPSFLFPSKEIDDTLKKLSQHRVTALVEEVEESHRLAKGTLGHVR